MPPLRGAAIGAPPAPGGLKTRLPLLESLLHRQVPTSPKLDPVLAT